MKYLKTIFLFVGILLLSHEIYSQANSVTHLKTENGRDYYLISIEMNVRKSYHDIKFNPYPNNLGSDKLTRRRMKVNIPYRDAKFESVMMFDTYKGAKRPYIIDDKPYKNTDHKGLRNPSGHEAAIYLIKTENEQTKIELFLGNWKHNWNRFNQLEIVYSISESSDKDKFASVVVSPQMPSKAIIIGPIPFFSFDF